MLLVRSALAILVLLQAAATLGASQPLRIASWNLNSLSGSQRTLSELHALAAQTDILILQEAVSPKQGDLSQILAKSSHPYRTALGSNAIASRFPIRNSGTVHVRPAFLRVLPWADLDTPAGLVRVYAVHLTYKLGSNPLAYDLRASEISLLLQHAQSVPHPVILAGDFNSLGSVLLGHSREPSLDLVRRAGFRDSLSTDPGATHLLLGRLDWIFSRGLHTASAQRGQYSGSDHRWIRTTLSFSPAPQPNPTQHFFAALIPTAEPLPLAIVIAFTLGLAYLASLIVRTASRSFSLPTFHNSFSSSRTQEMRSASNLQ